VDEVFARLRRRWKAAALGAVVIAAAVALPVTLLSQRQNAGGGLVARLTDTAATPPGWVPVAHGDAEISVPADWRVSTRPVCGRVGLGYVVLGTRSTSLLVRNPRCRQAANMAAILREPRIGGHPAGTASVINGIRVWRVAHRSISVYFTAVAGRTGGYSALAQCLQARESFDHFLLRRLPIRTINTATALLMIFYQGQNRIGRIFGDFTQTFINRRLPKFILVNKGRLK